MYPKHLRFLFLFSLLSLASTLSSAPCFQTISTGFQTKTNNSISISLDQVCADITPNYTDHYYYVKYDKALNPKQAMVQASDVKTKKGTLIPEVGIIPIFNMTNWIKTTTIQTDVNEFETITQNLTNLTTGVEGGIDNTKYEQYLLRLRTGNWKEDIFNITISNTLLDPTISACGVISSGGAYTLTQNISNASGDCITTSATGISLDCQGYTINSSSFGIKDTNGGNNYSNCVLTGAKGFSFNSANTIFNNINATTTNEPATPASGTCSGSLINNSRLIAYSSEGVTCACTNFTMNNTYLEHQRFFTQGCSLMKWNNVTAYQNATLQVLGIYGGDNDISINNSNFSCSSGAYSLVDVYITGGNNFWMENTILYGRGTSSYSYRAEVDISAGQNATLKNVSIISEAQGCFATNRPINTLLNVSCWTKMTNQTGITIRNGASTANVMLNSTIRGDSWINASASASITLNNSIFGNAYVFQNGTYYLGNWTCSANCPWADANTSATGGLPVNATTAPSGYWIGSDFDYHPYMYSSFWILSLITYPPATNYQSFCFQWQQINVSTTDNTGANESVNCSRYYQNGTLAAWLNQTFTNNTPRVFNFTLSANEINVPFIYNCTALVNGNKNNTANLTATMSYNAVYCAVNPVEDNAGWAFAALCFIGCILIIWGVLYWQ